jgi:hypothetical protein
MTVTAITNFAGMIPIKDRSLLPDNAAAYCRDVWLYKGTLQGLNQKNPVYTAQDPSIQSVYRIPIGDAPEPNFPASLWLEFEDPFMSVARAPMAEDQYNRYYFFSSQDNTPPTYNPLARIKAGNNPYILGVPAPGTAPDVTNSGGTQTAQEVRAYVYTWSTEFDEEGPPSPPTTVEGTLDGVWRVRVYQPQPSDNLHRSLKWVNIYRTVTDATGTATYYRLAQLPLSQVWFRDNFNDGDASAGLVLPSLGLGGGPWTAPPADLQGVVVMANGILAGFSNDKEIWFCEAYAPHAWPSGYALTVDSPIVALAAVGSSLVVLTESTPWMATGVTPGTMTIGKITSKEPCISRGSVMAVGEGVYYASPNGLILVNMMGTMNVTQAFMSKKDWTAVNPYNLHASKYATAYVAFTPDTEQVETGFIIDVLNPNVAFSWLSFKQGMVTNVYSDEFSGSTFILCNGEVFEWNSGDETAQVPYVWKSKQFMFPYAQDYVGGKIYFEIPDSLNISPKPSGATRNTDQNQSFNPNNQYLLLRAYADERLVMVREIQTNGEQFLLPSGFKATYWQFELEGQVNVKNLQLATSIKELQQV